jgi:DNA recombination protein RmuC
VGVDLHRCLRTGRSRDPRRPSRHHPLKYADDFRRLFPDAALDEDVLFTDDGRVLTSAGLSAGIDLCLHIVRSDHGAAVANTVAGHMVVAPWRDGGQAQFIERHVGDGRVTAPAPARERRRVTLDLSAHVPRHPPRTGLRPDVPLSVGGVRHSGGMDTGTLLPLLLTLLVGVGLGTLIGMLWARSRGVEAPPLIAALEQRAADDAVVRDGLDRLQDQLSDLSHDRVAWQAQLHQQVADMRLSAEGLRRETSTLATALRKPQVRGQWGELHLRRTVELAGLVDHCDFAEQVRFEDGRLRPDLVVTLAGGRTIAVDAKAPLAAFLDAAGTDDPAEHDRALQRLGEHVRKHVNDLGSRRYWEAMPQTPEFVVLFVPSETILQAALQAVPDLVEQAAAKNVVLATPSTLIALLRTVAQGWQHEVLNAQAQQVQRLGQELHSRLGSMATHLDRVGRALGAAVAAYNAGVGSLEGRVLVTARRFSDLGVTADDLPAPRQVEAAPRRLSAPEFGADDVSAGVLHTDDLHTDDLDPDDFEVDDFEALGEVARPGIADAMLFNSAPEADGPRIRRA